MPRETTADIVDERSGLLGKVAGPYSSISTFHGLNDGIDEGCHGERRSSSASIVPERQFQWKEGSALVLGVFLVNSDSAILLAIFQQIASDLDALPSASWIITSYLVGIIIAQPLFGKLSDIYGRKSLLLAAYCCYCVGGVLGGIGFSFYGVLLGRFIAGVGNAGITVLVSTLIVDLVPRQDVAVWRSLVYAVNQTGRAIGPSLGGFIADNANWRWALLYQAPLNVLSLIYIWRKITFPPPPQTEDTETTPPRSKFRRIDLSGAISLGLANCSLLLFLDQIQMNFDNLWRLWTVLPGGTWIACIAVFIVVEAFWAKEPILPLRLMARRNVFSSYTIQFLQTAAQLAFYTSVPLYFRVTQGSSNTTVAIRLLIITLGTILGGLISGFFIKWTGLHRLITWISLALSNASFFAIFLRWRGSTGWLECLYGFPVGLGFGVSLSAAFIALTARLDPSEVAVSTSGFYLSLHLGSLIGVSFASLLVQTSVQHTLLENLKDLPNRHQIVRDIVSNFDNISRLSGGIKELVLEAYIESLVNVWLFALVCGLFALVASFTMREGKINRRSNKRGGN